MYLRRGSDVIPADHDAVDRRRRLVASADHPLTSRRTSGSFSAKLQSRGRYNTKSRLADGVRELSMASRDNHSSRVIRRGTSSSQHTVVRQGDGRDCMACGTHPCVVSLIVLSGFNHPVDQQPWMVPPTKYSSHRHTRVKLRKKVNDACYNGLLPTHSVEHMFGHLPRETRRLTAAASSAPEAARIMILIGPDFTRRSTFTFYLSVARYSHVTYVREPGCVISHLSFVGWSVLFHLSWVYIYIYIGQLFRYIAACRSEYTRQMTALHQSNRRSLADDF